MTEKAKVSISQSLSLPAAAAKSGSDLARFVQQLAAFSMQAEENTRLGLAHSAEVGLCHKARHAACWLLISCSGGKSPIKSK